MTDILMPRLSDSSDEATIVRWLKQDGEFVTEGDDLIEIETDKVLITYPAEASGYLEILVSADEMASVGHPIARLLAADYAKSGEPR